MYLSMEYDMRFFIQVYGLRPVAGALACGQGSASRQGYGLRPGKVRRTNYIAPLYELCISFSCMGLKVVGVLRFARSPGSRRFARSPGGRRFAPGAVGFGRRRRRFHLTPPLQRAQRCGSHNPVKQAQRGLTHNPYAPFTGMDNQLAAYSIGRRPESIFPSLSPGAALALSEGQSPDKVTATAEGRCPLIPHGPLPPHGGCPLP